MFRKDNTTRDTFSLGLGGMTAITSFAPAPAIAHDRLRQVRKNRPQQGSADRECSQFTPLASLYRTVHNVCA